MANILNSNNLIENIDKSVDGYDKKKFYKIGKLMIPSVLVYIFVILFFFVGIYLIISPFIPDIKYNLFDKGKVFLPYESQIESNIISQAGVNNQQVIQENKKAIPEGRRLVIPSINVDLSILEGVDDSTLTYGVWWRPGTGNPIAGSNMVLTGHRLGYGFLPTEISTQSSFYNLDKVQDGDYVIIYWDGKEYDYQVSGGETVLPTETRIEDATKDPKLTLYTCTPIGVNTHRLVKYAKPVVNAVTTTITSSESSVSTSASSSNVSSTASKAK